MNLTPATSSSTPEVPSARTALRWTQKLGLLAVGLLGSLILTEVGLRLAGIEFHMHPVSLEFGYPNPQVMEDYFSPHPDYLWVAKGYDQKLVDARATEPYLIFSGCSCTAWGRFAQPLARRVRKAEGTRPLQLANLACSGWSSYSGLQQLQQDVLDLKPKVLAIYFGWNDHWVGYGVDDKTAGELASSVLVNTQSLRVVQMLTRGMVAHERANADDGARPLRVSLPDFRANIEAMVDLALENGIEPVLITAPTAHRKGEEPEYLRGRWIENLEDLVPLHQSYVEVVREVATARNVALCDLALLFEQMPREKMVPLLMEDGIHFTPEGGERVGGLLFRCLQKNELLPMADGSGPKRRAR